MILSNIQILLFQSDAYTTEHLQNILTQEGYQIRVAPYGEPGLQLAKSILPDLIVMDWTFQKTNGLEACSLLRAFPEFRNTLIAFFTDFRDDQAQIAGLNAGADAYITKPINSRVLITRIKSMLRQKIKLQEKKATQHLLINGLSIDRNQYLVMVDGKKEDCSKREFDLLWLLMSNPEKVLSRSMLVKQIWGNNSGNNDRALDVYISKLRAKIGDHRIKTMKGMGYKFLVGASRGSA